MATTTTSKADVKKEGEKKAAAAAPESNGKDQSKAAQAAAAAAAGAAQGEAAGFASASLYVGDLAPDVVEAHLFEVFDRIGRVASIRVCRDAITRRSLGYAYVNYNQVADAEKAQTELNNSLVRGRPCRVMWSQRDPQTRKSGKGNIFIKNLAKDIDHRALYDTFSQFGQILSCKIELDHKGESKGYGFIQFNTDEAADKAVATVNGKMLKDKTVFVGPFVPKKERLAAASEREFTNVFVKNLPASVDNEKLMELFSGFGPIKSAVVMTSQQAQANGEQAGSNSGSGSDSGDNSSKGFGFVDFEESEDAQLAVQDMNGQEVDGKIIYVGRAQKKYERENELRSKFEQMRNEQISKYQGANLYVKNIDDDWDDDKLRQVFAVYGTITSAKVMTDPRGVSKGFGFVCFSAPEEATKAVQELHGKILGAKPLYVAIHQRKEQRRVQLETQFAARSKVMTGGPGAAGGRGGGGPMGGGPGGMPAGGMPFYGPNGAPMPFYGAAPAGYVYQGMMPMGGMPGQQQQQQQQQGGGRGGPQQQGGQGQQRGFPAGPGGVYPGMAGAGGQFIMMPNQQGGGGGGRGGGGNQNPNQKGQQQQRNGAGGANGQQQGGGRGGRGKQQQQQQHVFGGGDFYQQQQAAAQQQQQQQQPGTQLEILAQALASYPPSEQKAILGERLFPLIHKNQPELAGKITGMILESCPMDQILPMLEKQELLDGKVEEALRVLREHQGADASATKEAAQE